MIVNCKKCSKVYKLNLTNMSSAKAKFTCTSCGYVNLIEIYDHQDSNIDVKNDNVDTKDLNDVEERSGVLWYKSVKTKLSYILVVSAFLIFGLYSWYYYYSAKNNISVELKQFAENTASRLSLTLMVPVWEVNENQVEKIINTEMMDPRIHSIVIRDDDGSSIFAAYSRSPSWKIVKVSQTGVIDGIQSSQKIIRQSEFLGQVDVTVTDKFMRAEIMKSTKELLFAVLVQICVLIAAMYIAMKKLIIDKVSKLTLATKQISLGNLNTKIEVGYGDEMDILAQSISRMQSSLRIVMEQYL